MIQSMIPEIPEGDQVELVYQLPGVNKTVFGPVTRRQYRAYMNKPLVVDRADAEALLAKYDQRRRSGWFVLAPAEPAEAGEPKAEPAAPAPKPKAKTKPKAPEVTDDGP